MTAASVTDSERVSPAAPPLAGDQSVVLHGVTWATYCAMRALIESPGVRMTYLEGALEIMSPGRPHEEIKTRIARLLELFAIETELALYGYGSTTMRREERERGLEPDECYTVGHQMGEYPDIAIEVIVTHWGVNKLDVYRGLGVREVWLWRGGAIQVLALGEDGAYHAREGSAFVPELSMTELAELAAIPDQVAALAELRSRLRLREGTL